MSKQDKIASFDLNAPASSEHLFGLPFDKEECEIHVLPAPWEVTVSYGAGTAEGPAAISEASSQVDLYDERYPNGWQRGIWMHEIDATWATKNESLRAQAATYICGYEGSDLSDETRDQLARINDACANFHQWVHQSSREILAQDKRLILLGGDHSTSLGALRAHKEKYGDFGILQIDAHADLRPAYEGFTYSHASIMWNALQEELASQLTIVGLRDYCHQEAEYIAQHSNVTAFTEHGMRKVMFDGQTWSRVVRNIIDTLPEQIYLSVDIDGFDPSLCPNTGTPVPGGLSVAEFLYLLDAILATGRKIIGADLVEVAPGKEEWDANVGARVLYAISHRLA